MGTDARIGDADLDMLQRVSFDYFVHESSTKTGLIVDKTENMWPASIAATGLALAGYPIGVERGFISREAAVARTLKTLRFFAESEQSDKPDATGYKGFYYHFLDMGTGRRHWNCELSTIDTAFLLAGALTASVYFTEKTREEEEIRQIADFGYRRCDWQWALDGCDTVSNGWYPETGFIPYQWKGYDEGMILYILGMGSPTFPLPDSCYGGWSSSYRWEKCYGIEYLYAGPLFTHQLSHIWVDFRGIQDDFMRSKGIDYFENSRRATQVQQRYAIDNPHKFECYSAECWGFTACDGPGPVTKTLNGIERQFFGYEARGAPFGPDDGGICPWVVAASMPFAPDIVHDALAFFINIKLHESNSYGFKATYNPTYPADDGDPNGWQSPYHYGIDQGPIVLMIENYRTEFLWRLMKKCPYIEVGLRRAGFRGGWLG